MPFGIGIWEMLILLLVLLLVFGPKRLPEMGRQLGRGMREFKETITGENDHDDADVPAPPTVSIASSADQNDAIPDVLRPDKRVEAPVERVEAPVKRVEVPVAHSTVDEPKLSA